MVKKKKASKRLSLRFKKGLEKKVAHHHRKQRKIAKLKGLTRRKKISKDPGIPNLWPFKEKLLGDLEANRQRELDSKAREKARLRKQREKKRRQEMVEKAATRALVQPAQQQKDSGNGNGNSDGFFLGEVKLKEQGAVKRHWYYKELKKVVQVADVVLEVLDARDPIGCRCQEVERQLLSYTNPDGSVAKRLILVLNKIDLVPSNVVARWMRYLKRFFPTLAFKSSTQQQRRRMNQFKAKTQDVDQAQLSRKVCIGAPQLMGLLKNYARTVGKSKKTITVGVIGFPNVGKSSIINSLKRCRAVAVGSTPGLTKSVQTVRLDKHITLVDSPGVLFGSDADKTLVLRNCLRVEQLEDPIAAVSVILERVHADKMMTLYRLARFETVEQFLVQLANKLGKIGRGGVPNLKLAARHVLKDWNSGTIPFYTLPPAVQDVTASTLVSGFSKEFDVDSYEKGSSQAMMELEQQQQQDAERNTSYVVLEHDQKASSSSSSAQQPAQMEDDDGDSDDDDDGSTVGVRRLRPHDPQTNRQIRALQKKRKKKRRRALRQAAAQGMGPASAMQSEPVPADDGGDWDEDEDMAGGQSAGAASNAPVDTSADYDFATDWS